MQKIAIRTAAVVLGAALSVAGAASVAEADTKSIKDPKPNITKVTVKHGSENIKVTTRTGVIRPGTYLTVYLDTDPSNPGPEYRNDLVPASELSPLMRIEKFGEQGHAVPCDGLRGRGDVYGPKTVLGHGPAQLRRGSRQGPGVGPGLLRRQGPERRRLGARLQEARRLGAPLSSRPPLDQVRPRGGRAAGRPGSQRSADGA